MPIVRLGDILMSDDSRYDDLDADIEERIMAQAQKSHDQTNAELLQLIKYRTQKNWYATASIIAIFSVFLVMMMVFIANGKDIQPEWKEILLVMLGAFVGSWAKVIDFWFSNSERDNALLRESTTTFD